MDKVQSLDRSNDATNSILASEAWIELNIEGLIKSNGSMKLLAQMFGLSAEGLKLITSEELAKVHLFVKEVSKSICKKYQESYNESMDMNEKDYVWNLMSSYLVHDVCHSIQLAGLRSADDKLPVHSFLRDGGLEVNGRPNKAHIEEELFLSIFYSNSSLDLPISLRILNNRFDAGLIEFVHRSDYDDFRKEAVMSVCNLDMEDFNSYVYKFMMVAMYMPDLGTALNTTNIALSNLRVSDKDMTEHVVEYYKEKIKQRVEIYKDIEKLEFDSDIIDLLYYVWSHRENKRVLLDLFFILTKDFFDNMDKKYSANS